ncbi:hypothetical protein RvY_12026 [Ramazzottius varieornatus]|uniref:Uncharacterized protein n=1 Tax=Ramazzottius varieornatus TaxID=947166 RepID=A0A1D1VRW1_RAMVA|nr:hypothetical protein RvY_12026 [Ramazzottius varieornatus]
MNDINWEKQEKMLNENSHFKTGNRTGHSLPSPSISPCAYQDKADVSDKISDVTPMDTQIHQDSNSWGHLMSPTSQQLNRVSGPAAAAAVHKFTRYN